MGSRVHRQLSGPTLTRPQIRFSGAGRKAGGLHFFRRVFFAPLSPTCTARPFRVIPPPTVLTPGPSLEKEPLGWRCASGGGSSSDQCVWVRFSPSERCGGEGGREGFSWGPCKARGTFADKARGCFVLPQREGFQKRTRRGGTTTGLAPAAAAAIAKRSPSSPGWAPLPPRPPPRPQDRLSRLPYRGRSGGGRRKGSPDASGSI